MFKNTPGQIETLAESVQRWTRQQLKDGSQEFEIRAYDEFNDWDSFVTFIGFEIHLVGQEISTMFTITLPASENGRIPYQELPDAEREAIAANATQELLQILLAS